MNHLDEIRILEIALDARASITEQESTHLKTCTSCADQLKTEQQFSQTLSQISPIKVPEGFAARATAAFAQAARTRVPVTLRRPLLAGVGLAVIFAACSLWWIIGNFTLFTTYSAAVISQLATVVRAAAVVVNNLPGVANVLMIGMGALALASTGLLATLFKRSAIISVK